MSRLRAQFWISVAGTLLLFVGMLISDALGWWGVGWTCVVAMVFFVFGRMLWAIVDLHYTKKTARRGHSDWAMFEAELAKAQEQRKALWRSLLPHQNGDSER